MSGQDGRSEWLPVISFAGIDYVVDIAGRQFRQCHDLGRSVGFHSDTGRMMIRAMAGTEWRIFMPRRLCEKESEQVV